MSTRKRLLTTDLAPVKIGQKRKKDELEDDCTDSAPRDVFVSSKSARLTGTEEEAQ